MVKPPKVKKVKLPKVTEEKILKSHAGRMPGCAIAWTDEQFDAVKDMVTLADLNSVKMIGVAGFINRRVVHINSLP